MLTNTLASTYNNGIDNKHNAPTKGGTKMAERRYTTEQLESAETIMKMLAAVPKEKRAERGLVHECDLQSSEEV